PGTNCRPCIGIPVEDLGDHGSWRISADAAVPHAAGGCLDSVRCYRLAAMAAAAVTILAVPVALAVVEFQTGKSKGPSSLFPYRDLAAAVTELWRSETQTRLWYAAGPFDWVNAISFYSEDHPSSFADFNFGSALWITPTELRRNGVVIVCA